MARFDASSRRELRRRRNAWLRRNWKLIALLATGAFGLMLLLTVCFTWGPQARWRDYLLGVGHASVIGIFVFMLNATFLAHDRTAIHHVRGAWGEENTRDELRRAKRKGLIWDWVDSIDLDRGDLDHVVITRRGGLVVIDSKWRSDVDRASVQDMTRSARTAQARAEGLANTLLKREHGAKRRARARPLAVTSVVVLWGGAAQDVPDDIVRDGIHFVRGRQLLSWLKGLDHYEVDRDAAGDLTARLKDYRLGVWDPA